MNKLYYIKHLFNINTYDLIYYLNTNCIKIYHGSNF